MGVMVILFDTLIDGIIMERRQSGDDARRMTSVGSVTSVLSNDLNRRQKTRTKIVRSR